MLALGENLCLIWTVASAVGGTSRAKTSGALSGVKNWGFHIENGEFNNKICTIGLNVGLKISLFGHFQKYILVYISTFGFPHQNVGFSSSERREGPFLMGQPMFLMGKSRFRNRD